MAVRKSLESRLMVLQVGINKFQTREFLKRMEVQQGKQKDTENSCPACKNWLKKTSIQTKEHLLKGECICTKKLWEEMVVKLVSKANKIINIQALSASTINLIKDEWNKVILDNNTNKLENHAKSAALLGI